MFHPSSLTILFVRLMFMSTFSLCACRDADELNIGKLEQLLEMNNQQDGKPQAYFQNHPLPIGQGHLSVLAIGNSFAVDAVWYVRDVLEAAGLDASTYSVYFISHTAASLEHWWAVTQQNEQVDIIHQAGHKMLVERGTLADLLAQDWDVITLQQYSEDAVNYDSFNPWLRRMVDFILAHCAKKEVTLAWQMAWSYNDMRVTTYSNYERWLLIAYATQQMMRNDGIDVLIPVGTAIQNARNTSLNGESQLTRDGWHLDLGIGRYIAACTWVQALFAPVYGFSVTAESSIPPMAKVEYERYPSQPVTQENLPLCQQCALDAVLQPFHVVK